MNSDKSVTFVCTEEPITSDIFVYYNARIYQVLKVIYNSIGEISKHTISRNCINLNVGSVYLPPADAHISKDSDGNLVIISNLE